MGHLIAGVVGTVVSDEYEITKGMRCTELFR